MINGVKIMNFKNKGFTLLEVMIALALFSVFFVVFLSSQSSNFISSNRMEKRLIMHNIAENVMSDLLTAPPPLNPSLTLKPQVFKYENNDDYEYSIEYKQFELPNIFTQPQEGEESSDSAQNQQSQYVDLLYKQVKENVKEALWQVRISVIEKETKYEYWLTAWLRNPNFEIRTDLPKF